MEAGVGWGGAQRFTPGAACGGGKLLLAGPEEWAHPALRAVLVAFMMHVWVTGRAHLCVSRRGTPTLGTPGPVCKCCWMAAFLEAAFLAELL